MNDGSPVKQKVKKIDLKALSKEITGFEPGEALTPRERQKNPNAYFNMLDAGRDYLLWSKRYGSIKKNLPKHLGKMILELEKIAQKMNMTAIENSFDYSVNYNDLYFDMMQAENVSLLLNHTLKNFMKSEKALKAVGAPESPERKKFVAHIQKLAATASNMSKSISLFMNQMEREFVFEDKILEKRREALTPND
ncbi:MAG: hypothetical protein K6F99_06045 [Lachnospiraceae bacterium]|nr:hypothetical protein [Lachnospiraceae bacterium]